MHWHGYWLGCVLVVGLLAGGPTSARPWRHTHTHSHGHPHAYSPVRGSLESAVLAEINFARTQPAAYARRMRQGERSYDGGGDRYADRGDYGYGDRSYGDRVSGYGGSARAEAIDFLAGQRPLRALNDNQGLSAAAARLANEQAQSGKVGHTSALRERTEAHGVWSGMVAETISYGMATPAAVVQQLIIYDGVPDRGHREVLFDQSLSVAGVACGPQRTYGHMCVIDFAGAVVRR